MDIVIATIMLDTGKDLFNNAQYFKLVSVQTLFFLAGLNLSTT